MPYFLSSITLKHRLSAIGTFLIRYKYQSQYKLFPFRSFGQSPVLASAHSVLYIRLVCRVFVIQNLLLSSGDPEFTLRLQE